MTSATDTNRRIHSLSRQIGASAEAVTACDDMLRHLRPLLGHDGVTGEVIDAEWQRIAALRDEYRRDVDACQDELRALRDRQAGL